MLRLGKNQKVANLVSHKYGIFEVNKMYNYKQFAVTHLVAG